MYTPVYFKDQPGNFIMRVKEPNLICEVHDISNLSPGQVNQFKSKNPIYCTTETPGRYLMLTFHAILKAEYLYEMPEMQARRELAKLLVEAGDFVHDQIIKSQN